MLRRSWRRYGAFATLGPLTVLLTSCVGVSLIRSHVYFPDPLPAELDWQGVPPPLPMRVQTEDGLTIEGYRWPATTASFATLIFFHGNAGNRYTAAVMAAPLRRPDVEIIVASYRGYGGNPGRPSEAGLYRDGAAFLRAARLGTPKHLYLFGFSLGASVALRLAADQSVDGVVTLGAFSSLASVAPWWAGPFLPDRFDNVSAARRLRTSLLILHGSRDETIPIAEASKIGRAASPPPQIIILRDAPHRIRLDPIARMIWDQLIHIARHQPAAAIAMDGVHQD